MAFSVKISGLTSADIGPLWEIEAPWWEERELLHDERFKDVSEDSSYPDFEAVLTLKEAQDLADRYCPKALSWMKERVEILDRELANESGATAKVRVLVFEWESGLG